MRRNPIFTILLTTYLSLFLLQNTYAQMTGIIVDNETQQAIPYVNIFTKIDNQVFGTVSDQNGKFSVNFNFKTLFLSHINYEQIEILSLKDTVFLKPKNEILNEVVVMNKQPEWISKSLKKILDNKSKNYQLKDKQFSYNYKTYTLNDSNGYAFASNGNLIVPQLKKNVFEIFAKNNVIRYKDKTAGVDFSNLQRMLYHNFINILEKSFITQNKFNQDFSYQSKNKNLVKLYFSSNKSADDGGSLVIDTLNNLIFEIERNSGTDFNLKTQTTGLLRNAAKNTLGFSYNTWITKTYTKYEKFGDSYYISECRYKLYMKTATKNKKIDSEYFTSIESELYLNAVNSNENNSFIVIPEPYYLLPIMTKKRRTEEEKLKNVKVTFENF